MQDKEFDELFKNRFESAEIEPSANLWSNIEEKLVVKRKRVFPVYWSAAAAIVAVATIGLLFQKTEKIQSGTTAAITQQAKENNTNEEGSVLPTSPNSTDNYVPASKEQRNGHLVALQHNTEVSKHRDNVNATTAMVADQGTQKKDLLAMQPSVAISHLDYKEVKIKREKAELPKSIAAPVEEVMLATADVAPEAADETEREVAVDDNKGGESKGIRNMGDLINYVVDKVDKREEKFIQFKTDEDDNSSLIGLNIGMFKFSQKKHK